MIRFFLREIRDERKRGKKEEKIFFFNPPTTPSPVLFSSLVHPSQKKKLRRIERVKKKKNMNISLFLIHCWKDRSYLLNFLLYFRNREGGWKKIENSFSYFQSKIACDYILFDALKLWAMDLKSILCFLLKRR